MRQSKRKKTGTKQVPSGQKGINPILSVAIIFKNEIRCLERCLTSLKPLQDAVPVQIVMADTGSDDGSREIAEKYADIVFDFPWMNDFAAARNAVLDRCTGSWILILDADEWMDEDCRQMAGFLQSTEYRGKYEAAAIKFRNYTSEVYGSEYTDFISSRMFRRDLHIRYVGAIHECWDKAPTKEALVRTLFHHDGYIDLGNAKGNEKRKRNMELLEKELEKKPEDLRTLLQCMDSSLGNAQYLWRALEGVRKKHTGWDRLGPLIFRSAVIAEHDPKKKGALIQEMHELFPDSIFTKIDLAYTEILYLGQEKRYDEAIGVGKGFLAALKDYRENGEGQEEVSAGTLISISPCREMMLRTYMAECYFQKGLTSDAVAMLETLRVEDIDGPTAQTILYIMLNLYIKNNIGMEGHMLRFWEKLTACGNAEELIKTFREVAFRCFTPKQRKLEDDAGQRHSYTIYLPMEGKDEIGNAAAMMEETDAAKLTQRLMEIEKWEEFPIYAIAHALLHGAQYPMPGSAVTLEEIDTLVGRLNAVDEAVPTLALRAADGALDDWTSLIWSRALTLAAVRSYHWDTEKETAPGQGVKLVQAFAKVEEKYLPRCYSPEALTRETVWTLPFMHRFGWYCAKAFQARNEGDAVTYISLLREGMRAAPETKKTVAYLLDEIERQEKERKIADAPAELLELAEQMRKVLAQFPDDHPAVLEIKRSPAYQKVSWLIEEPNITV